MSLRTLRFALLGVASTGAIAVGCLNEYHPEYHPETSYRYEQTVTYPTTVLQAAATATQSLAESAPHPDRTAPRMTRAVAQSTPPPTPHVEAMASPPEPGGATTTGTASRPTGSELDSQLSAACLADDATACRRLAALHVGNRRQGKATGARSGNAFDPTVRGFAWHTVEARVAGSNGGAPGMGPRVAVAD